MNGRNDRMDVDIPRFDPRKYTSECQFPFFDRNTEDYLKMLGKDALIARDDSIKQVNDCCSQRNIEKYTPIIISTSRGMGKTTFMEAIGMQLVKEELKNSLIGNAISYGRILSFDFSKQPDAIQNVDDVYSFFSRLMIYFLCRMFDGTQVDGIHFKKIEDFRAIPTYKAEQPLFLKWLSSSMKLTAESMMDEYIRLTNMAFEVECKSPPVFLWTKFNSCRLRQPSVPRVVTACIRFCRYCSLSWLQSIGQFVFALVQTMEIFSKSRKCLPLCQGSFH